MKIKQLLVILPLILFVISCGNSDKIDPKLLKTYKEILIARETIQDTALANKEVSKIFTKNGFTEPEFRRQMMDASKDKKVFMEILDSVRSQLQRDLNKKH